VEFFAKLVLSYSEGVPLEQTQDNNYCICYFTEHYR